MKKNFLSLKKEKMTVEAPTTEQVTEATESSEKTPEKLTQELMTQIITNAKFEEIDKLCTEITKDPEKTSKVLKILTEEQSKTTDNITKNRYGTAKEVLNLYIDFAQNVVPAVQAGAENLADNITESNNTIKAEDLTFKIYGGLNETYTKNEIVQKLGQINNQDLSRLFSDFKNLTDRAQKEQKMKEIQNYLNQNIKPSPGLTVDGKYGQKTHMALSHYPIQQQTPQVSATPEQTETDTPKTKIETTDIQNIKLYGRGNIIPAITPNELTTTCNADTIPEAAKRSLKAFFQQKNIVGLQNYLNSLLVNQNEKENKTGPIIDKRKFKLTLNQKYGTIPTDAINGFDRNDAIKPDGYLGPQTLVAISCIEEKQPEPDLNNNPPDNPEVTLSNEEKQTKIKEQITKGLKDYNTDNIDFSQLNDNKIGLTFKETVEGEEKENKIIFNWKEGTLQFEGCNKTLQIGETLKIDNLIQELTDKTDNNLPKYRTFGFAASLGSLLSKTKAKKCKGLYYCTYDEGDKNIKIHSLSYDEHTKQITSTDSELFEKGDNNVDQLTQLNTDFKLNDTLTKQETQENIAKFMTLNIDKTQDHWNEAKQEIQKDILYKNENFD